MIVNGYERCCGCNRPLYVEPEIPYKIEECSCHEYGKELMFKGTCGPDDNEFWVYAETKDKHDYAITVHIHLYSTYPNRIQDEVIKANRVCSWLECRWQW